VLLIAKPRLTGSLDGPRAPEPMTTIPLGNAHSAECATDLPVTGRGVVVRDDDPHGLDSTR